MGVGLFTFKDIVYNLWMDIILRNVQHCSEVFELWFLDGKPRTIGVSIGTSFIAEESAKANENKAKERE